MCDDDLDDDDDAIWYDVGQAEPADERRADRLEGLRSVSRSAARALSKPKRQPERVCGFHIPRRRS
jgi:hypothetical protein